jgi:hypothetical protein
LGLEGRAIVVLRWVVCSAAQRSVVWTGLLKLEGAGRQLG